MVAKRALTKTSAKKRAKKARRRGMKASVFKKKRGYGVSVTKRKKRR